MEFYGDIPQKNAYPYLMSLFEILQCEQGSFCAVFVQSKSIKIYKKYTAHVFKVYFNHVIMVGKREEAGDTVRYYLISAIQKSVATELVNAFSEYRMKITTISCGVYNQYCLSELYFNEYEHLNRLLIDFGTKNIRTTAFSQGVAVYTRTIDTGFDTYVTKLFESQAYAGKPDICEMLYSVGEKLTQTDKKQKNNMYLINDEEYLETINVVDSYICNEIKRVIDLCANNDVVISKIYYTGFVINGFEMFFTSVICSDDIIIEGLARAAMNYAANRYAYIAKVEKINVTPAFLRLGFSGDDILSVEIPVALTSGCSCEH